MNQYKNTEDFIDEIKRLRKPYTNETYSPKLTVELLYNLHTFLNMKIVEEKKLFSKYDKASLLCAIEVINQQQKEIERLKKGIDRSVYDLANEDISDEYAVDQIRMDLVSLLRGGNNMNKYHIDLNPYFCPLEFDLYHKENFSQEKLERMMLQTVKEMRWNGIRMTYGNENNYMMDHFGFWTK